MEYLQKWKYLSGTLEDHDAENARDLNVSCEETFHVYWTICSVIWKKIASIWQIRAKNLIFL